MVAILTRHLADRITPYNCGLGTIFCAFTLKYITWNSKKQTPARNQLELIKNILRYLILIYIIGTLISCENRSGTDVKKVEFFFHPTFEHSTKFIIDIENKRLEQFMFQDYFVETLDDTDTSEPYIVEHGDTLITYYHKTFQIEYQDLNNFLLELASAKLDTTVKHSRRVLDGIRFEVNQYNSNQDTTKLWSVSPIRTEKFEMDYIILDAFFELAYKTVDDYEGIRITEEIQMYFHYWPIRPIASNPLEIRVYDRLDGGYSLTQEEVTKWINKFPHEPIIFDFRHGSLCHCLYPALDELSKKREIYFYGKNEVNDCEKVLQEQLDKENNTNDKTGNDNRNYWKDYQEYKKVCYNNWLNNQDIKWFSTKADVLKAIDKKSIN